MLDVLEAATATRAHGHSQKHRNFALFSQLSGRLQSTAAVCTARYMLSTRSATKTLTAPRPSRAGNSAHMQHIAFSKGARLVAGAAIPVRVYDHLQVPVASC